MEKSNGQENQSPSADNQANGIANETTMLEPAGVKGNDFPQGYNDQGRTQQPGNIGYPPPTYPVSPPIPYMGYPPNIDRPPYPHENEPIYLQPQFKPPEIIIAQANTQMCVNCQTVSSFITRKNLSEQAYIWILLACCCFWPGIFCILCIDSCYVTTHTCRNCGYTMVSD